MSTIPLLGVLALLMTSTVMGQVMPADWDAADIETVRLAPEKIDALPPPIQQELTRLGCTVPQVSSASDRPGNFIIGRFLASSQTHIAVLCSRHRISSILVFATGSTRPVAELAEAPDKDFLQVIDGNGRIGFSRSLEVAQPHAIRSYHANSGGPELPSLDHDGIADAFAEKGSRVWYWHAGQWLQLMGSD
ncbi:MAG: hypothetical protein ABW171_13560 [Steroidobacter sp.]